MNGNRKWRTVTKSEPCPACGKGDWCAWSSDGAILRCMRGGEPLAGMRFVKTDSNGGTLFAPDPPGRNGRQRSRPKVTPPASTNQRADLEKLYERFRSSLSAERLTELASALGVTPTAIESLGVGWATADDLRKLRASGDGWQNNRPDGAYAFPERAGDGRLVGFSFRTPDGRKGAAARAVGAGRGLVFSTTLHQFTGVLPFVEGASDVLAFLSLGVQAVGRPSNGSGAEDAARLLKGRSVMVVGENDAKPTGVWPGRDGAERVATQLATTWSKPVDWTLPPDNAKDVRAWLAARVANGLDLTDAEACRAAGAELVEALRTAAEKAEPAAAPNTAEQLVRLAHELYHFGRSQNDEPFAVAHDGPNVALLFKGTNSALRATLARQYRSRFGRTPNASAIADALTVLAGDALDAQPEPVFVRLAKCGDSIVVDIGDATGAAIVVRAGGWEIVDRSPVLFRRTKLTSPLPLPERGGTLDELRELLNVSPDTWPLVCGWLVAALIPNIPHPILLLSGLHGTGKSTSGRVLVTVVDPSPAPLRSEPRDLDQWAVAVSGCWAVAIDNLSSIPTWLSDALCKAVTGDGHVKRALYTDDDLSVLAFRRVMLLTSIDPGALRGDLGDRLVIADLEPISLETRRTEEEIDELLRERWPRILGALLDILAAVLAKLPDVKLARMPRMADFSRVLAALDATGMTEGRGLPLYLAQQGRVAAEVLDSDPFAVAVVRLVDAGGTWSGRAGDLLNALLGDDKPPREWPKSPQGVTGRLKRLIPALETQGVRVHIPKERSKFGRVLVLESAGESSSPSSPASLDGQFASESPDAGSVWGQGDDGDDEKPVLSDDELERLNRQLYDESGDLDEYHGEW